MANRNQVAKLAGVSVAAVSRVLNNSGYVSQEKRERVLAAVRELEYHPDPIARSLKNRNSHQLLFYIRDISNSYYIEMYTGMAGYANAHGYMVVVSGGFDGDRIKSLMIDGILLPSQEFATAEFLGGLKLPTVVATYGIPVDPSLVAVDANAAEAVRIAIEHLRTKGHERIGYLSNNVAIDDDPRQAAYLRELGPVLGAKLREAIIGPETKRGPQAEVRFLENGYEAGLQFLERRPEVSALVCFNDDSAIGFISCIQAHGIRVPEDISVVGIDGHWGGVYSSPPLTTVSISPRQHGAECARILIEMIEGEGERVEAQAIELKLLERSSVKLRS